MGMKAFIVSPLFFLIHLTIELILQQVFELPRRKTKLKISAFVVPKV